MHRVSVTLTRCPPSRSKDYAACAMACRILCGACCHSRATSVLVFLHVVRACACDVRYAWVFITCVLQSSPLYFSITDCRRCKSTAKQLSHAYAMLQVHGRSEGAARGQRPYLEHPMHIRKDSARLLGAAQSCKCWTVVHGVCVQLFNRAKHSM